ncbi:MAG: FAD/FMN-containing dehydrogenase [Ignavibacteria bacterium]|nr:FAD/FMN-containing dehydrogenase [Ignavibacteria bacterium]
MIQRTDIDTIQSYLTDASNLQGSADVVYIPEDIKELKQIIIKCHSENTPMNPAGAGTGLTGSRVPLSGVVISTEKLTKIISIDKTKQRITVEPGIFRSEIESELGALGYFVPPSPTEKNSAIGGNVATNASGARTFKYGAIREFITGLKVFLFNGEEIILRRGENFANNYELKLLTESGRKISLHLPSINMPEIKHAAGYFLKPNMDAIDLFIGSEGTLGIISEIELSFIPLPENVLGGIIFFDDENRHIQFVEEVRRLSKENNLKDYRTVSDVSARVLEFFDVNSVNLLRDKYRQIPPDAKGAIWFEQEFSSENESAVLESWATIISEYSALGDFTWIAQNEKEHENLRQFRHELPLQVYEVYSANSQLKLGTDIAVPDVHFQESYQFVKQEIQKLQIPYVIFGHIGNCHLHTNIFIKDEEERKRAYEFYDAYIEHSLKLGGTVSAEHGIGKLKKKYLNKMFGQEAINGMKAIKQILDEKYLLNVGTLFD